MALATYMNMLECVCSIICPMFLNICSTPSTEPHKHRDTHHKCGTDRSASHLQDNQPLYTTVTLALPIYLWGVIQFRQVPKWTSWHWSPFNSSWFPSVVIGPLSAHTTMYLYDHWLACSSHTEVTTTDNITTADPVSVSVIMYTNKCKQLLSTRHCTQSTHQ